MIDVLFMLMLFFLLGSRFGAHEGLLMSHLPQTTPNGPKSLTPPIPPVVIKLSERIPNKVSYQLGLGENPPMFEENFEVSVPEGAQPDELQINDAKLYDHLVKMKRDLPNLADVTVKIVPEASVQWNYCLQVLNTVSRAKYPEIRWSVPTRKKSGSP
jgi:biopolymer transport protein ExbD